MAGKWKECKKVKEWELGLVCKMKKESLFSFKNNRKEITKKGGKERKNGCSQTVLLYTCIPSSQEAEAGGYLDFEASLVYKMSSRTARVVTQRNSVSKKEK